MFSGMRKTRTLSLIHRINEGNIPTVETLFFVSQLWTVTQSVGVIKLKTVYLILTAGKGQVVTFPYITIAP